MKSTAIVRKLATLGCRADMSVVAIISHSQAASGGEVGEDGSQTKAGP